MSTRFLSPCLSLLAATILITANASASEKTNTGSKQVLPRPDGNLADMTKPVQVFILLGQSNMVGLGKIAGGKGSLEDAVRNQKKFQYLADDTGVWIVRKDVRFARMMQGDKFFREIESNCWDPAIRIEEYAKYNTQVQVVCTIPVLFAYWAQPADGLTVARYLNDHIADIVAKYPKHYVGLGSIPMQDTDMAIAELERCKMLGMKGVQIGSNVNQKNLGDTIFEPLWQAIQDLDMAVLEPDGRHHVATRLDNRNDDGAHFA